LNHNLYFYAITPEWEVFLSWLTSKKSELEERLNGIFGDDAPGFQKSTVISTNNDGETFTADVLERIQSIIMTR